MRKGFFLRGVVWALIAPYVPSGKGRAVLLADAEGGEDMAEQVVAADRTGDAAQRVVGKAQVFGDEFAVLAGVQLGEGVLVVAFGLVQGAQVAFARDVRAFFAAVTADGAGDGIAQGVNAGAGFG